MAQVLRLRLGELLGTFLAPHLLLACRGAVQVTIQSICIAYCDFAVEWCRLISMLLTTSASLSKKREDGSLVRN
jgi:hypothetical protein